MRFGGWLFRRHQPPPPQHPAEMGYDPILDPELALEDPHLREVLQLYRRLCGVERMPPWDGFSPRLVPPHLLPLLVVLDTAAEDPGEWHWRLIGTAVTDAVAQDPTGRRLSELYSGITYRRMLTAPIWVLRHGRPLRTRTCGAFAGAVWRPSENLFLPFAGSDGGIPRILLAAAFDPVEQP